MSEAWKRTHRRYELAEEVLRRVRRARRVEDVVDRWQEAIDREFGDLGGLLQHVQRQWYARLAVRLDVLLDPDGPNEDPRSLWRELCRDEPAMRRLLDAYADHEALRHGDAVNSDLVRRATGLTIAELAAPPVDARSRTAHRLPCQWLRQRCSALLHGTASLRA